jgi:hypothetical protein
MLPVSRKSKSKKGDMNIEGNGGPMTSSAPVILFSITVASRRAMKNQRGHA